MQLTESDTARIDRAFSTQASHYDADDKDNAVLQDWRHRVYDHVERFLSPAATILELNAGTGIDACHFARSGHHILATDLSLGMIAEMSAKVAAHNLTNVDVLPLAFEDLATLPAQQFDYIFSNFGGLNCIKDLTLVARYIPNLLKPDGYLTWVIMPPFSPWELLSALKGRVKSFRRLAKNGALAHVEGEYFQTYYHSMSAISRSLGSSFQLVRVESLGVVTPPPSSVRLVNKFPGVFSVLYFIERKISATFPFNRWGDHIIVTFQYKPVG